VPLPDARADGGLGQVQLPGGFQETAVGGDGEEGAGLVDIHDGSLISN